MVMINRLQAHLKVKVNISMCMQAGSAGWQHCNYAMEA
jgi:hypothetical protein